MLQFFKKEFSDKILQKKPLGFYKTNLCT